STSRAGSHSDTKLPCEKERSELVSAFLSGHPAGESLIGSGWRAALGGDSSVAAGRVHDDAMMCPQSTGAELPDSNPAAFHLTRLIRNDLDPGRQRSSPMMIQAPHLLSPRSTSITSTPGEGGGRGDAFTPHFSHIKQERGGKR
ncbi:hypothetical protein KUCAC02_027471, partial [Chaenocephalus aceratus]